MNKIWFLLALSAIPILAGMCYGPDVCKHLGSVIQVQKDYQAYQKKCLLP